jgi:hypothetical protein
MVGAVSFLQAREPGLRPRGRVRRGPGKRLLQALFEDPARGWKPAEWEMPRSITVSFLSTLCGRLTDADTAATFDQLTEQWQAHMPPLPGE